MFWLTPRASAHMRACISSRILVSSGVSTDSLCTPGGRWQSDGDVERSQHYLSLSRPLWVSSISPHVHRVQKSTSSSSLQTGPPRGGGGVHRRGKKKKKVDPVTERWVKAKTVLLTEKCIWTPEWGGKHANSMYSIHCRSGACLLQPFKKKKGLLWERNQLARGLARRRRKKNNNHCDPKWDTQHVKINDVLCFSNGNSVVRTPIKACSARQCLMDGQQMGDHEYNYHITAELSKPTVQFPLSVLKSLTDVKNMFYLRWSVLMKCQDTKKHVSP